MDVHVHGEWIYILKFIEYTFHTVPDCIQMSHIYAIRIPNRAPQPGEDLMDSAQRTTPIAMVRINGVSPTFSPPIHTMH